VAHRLAHPPHLAVAPFANRDLNHPVAPARVTAPGVQQRGFRRQRPAAVERNALPQPPQRLLVGHAGHARLVGALDSMTRMSEPRCQIPVVGEEQQALGVVVEPAHRIHVLAHPVQQVDHRSAALRIGTRRDETSRFVEQDVALALGGRQPSAVDADVVGVGVGLGAHLLHRRAVQRDAAVGDEPFGGAARRHTRLREDLLEALLHAGP